jgi:hypothetical protein
MAYAAFLLGLACFAVVFLRINFISGFFSAPRHNPDGALVTEDDDKGVYFAVSR